MAKKMERIFHFLIKSACARIRLYGYPQLVFIVQARHRGSAASLEKRWSPILQTGLLSTKACGMKVGKCNRSPSMTCMLEKSTISLAQSIARMVGYTMTK